MYIFFKFLSKSLIEVTEVLVAIFALGAATGKSNKDNRLKGDLDKPYSVEAELRQQEAQYTNNFLIEHDQGIRYEKKSDWLKNKWEKRLKE